MEEDLHVGSDQLIGVGFQLGLDVNNEGRAGG
jgi:hypothetical protein